MGLAHSRPGTLNLCPKRWVCVRHGDSAILAFTFGVFEVFVNLRLMVQIECDCPIDLRALQKRKVFLNRFRRLSAFERVHD